ncbi:MAG: glutaminyl-peptide cyclotransferase, partial [Thermoleophilaceae bacterium]|nr:glutaminyl-peptide cyclotransferase [Thermoleophilaceae bacterium]
SVPGTMGSVKLLVVVLAVQVAIGLTLVALVATDNLPFTGDHEANGSPARPAAVHTDRFDGAAAFELLREQVELGPRPAGSPQSLKLARRLWRIVPHGRFQRVPGGLHNVIGTVRGREPGYLVVGAHYDTKDIPGFVGANDGASGTAVVAQLARTIRRPRHTIHFIFFDGEEAPRGVPDRQFEKYGIRGAKVAAPRFAEARAMVLLDFVGDRDLSIPREGNSDPALWRKLRAAARRVGAGRVFPASNFGEVSDDHIPFIRAGVPSIDLIDFDFPCWHQTCDDLSAVSEKSVDAVGETIYELVRTL